MTNQKTHTGSFEVVEDTANLSIHVTSTTLEGLFTHALAGLAHLLYADYTKNGALQAEAHVKASSIDVNSLLVDFLSEALYQSEAHRSVFYSLSLDTFSNSALTGKISGSRVPQFDRRIKAVTYHGVRIVRNGRGVWQTDVVFDT